MLVVVARMPSEHCPFIVIFIEADRRDGDGDATASFGYAYKSIKLLENTSDSSNAHSDKICL